MISLVVKTSVVIYITALGLHCFAGWIQGPPPEHPAGAIALLLIQLMGMFIPIAVAMVFWNVLDKHPNKKFAGAIEGLMGALALGAMLYIFFVWVFQVKYLWNWMTSWLFPILLFQT